MIFFGVALYAVLWCVLHSVLLSEPVTVRLKQRLGRYGTWYRLAYNLTAAATLLPLFLFLHVANGPMVFGWSGWWQVLRFLLLGGGLALFYFGSRTYHVDTFLGVKQIRTGTDSVLLAREHGFSREGVLGVVRHPWYGGGLLLVCSFPARYDLYGAAVYGVFGVYLVVGAFIEERRLLEKFGREYETYRREVSMFFPWKWILMHWRGEEHGTR